MSSKGLLQTIVLLVAIIVIVVVTYAVMNSYSRSAADFGTWSDYKTTLCDNSGQGCGVDGQAERFRTCVASSKTGLGCIDDSGRVTYRPEVTRSTCTPGCYSSVWSGDETSGCQVYNTSDHSDTPSNAACKDPPQFAFERRFKTCVVQDASGPNACIKLDGSIAVLGETEELYVGCPDYPSCFAATWQTCPDPSSQVTDYCGGTTAQCGEVIPFQTPSVCLVNGDPVPSSQCYAPDDPGPCPRQCFNFPCTSTFPAGFGNVANLQNKFFEMTNLVGYMTPQWQLVNIACGPNPITTASGSTTIVITTPAPHGIPAGELIQISGATASVNGIPPASVNGLRLITAVTSTTMTVTANAQATTTGNSGGATMMLEQDPKGAAQDSQDALQSYGPTSLDFQALTAIPDRVRLTMVPSQAEVANGAFYMLGYLPYNGQKGLVTWNGSNLVISIPPSVALGQTFDDISPRPSMFKFTEPGAIQKLALYAPGGGTTDLFCTGAPCLSFRTCTLPQYEPAETCV